MKVWYVKYNSYDDDDRIDPNDTIFFATEQAAFEHLESINQSRKIAYESSLRLRKEKWEITEMAVNALDAIGIDWRITMPYHKREWKPAEYHCDFVLDSIEVNE